MGTDGQFWCDVDEDEIILVRMNDFGVILMKMR